MNRKYTEMLIWAGCILMAAALVLWVYYGALFGTEVHRRQREVSAVLYYAGPDGWESVQEGMKQAEDDFGVNISYVIMDEGADAAKQTELILREIGNGAEGLIIAAVDSEEMYHNLKEEISSVPVITVESGTGEDSFPSITADNYAMGQRLGEELLKDFLETGKRPVTVIDEYTERDSVKLRKEGLLDVLGDEVKVDFVQRGPGDYNLKLYLDTALGGMPSGALVALDKVSLAAATEISSELQTNFKLYGIGNTDSIVASLDKGSIQELVFQNEFNMGYLAVESLLHEIDSVRSGETQKIDYYSVNQEEIYETRFERLLFPIVE